MILQIVTMFLLSRLLATEGIKKRPSKLIISQEFYANEFIMHTTDHEIVSLNVPMNALNLDDPDSNENDVNGSPTLFYALADIDKNGEKIDKGLYVLKNNITTKLLETGRDSTAEIDDSKIMYFGAQDGLYYYNAKNNTAEKYGNITDSIIQLAKANGSDIIYILTEDGDLYNVTNNGTEKIKVEVAVKPEEIVMDFENNLYYFGDNKIPYVINGNGTKRIQGTPENTNYTKLVRPPFIFENCVPLICDDDIYVIFANGTSEKVDMELQVKPTAYSMDATLVQYYAYNKTIYEFNLLGLVFGGVLKEVKTYLQEFKNDIQALTSR